MVVSRRMLALLALLAVCPQVHAQESDLQSDLRRERQEIAASCGKMNFKALAGCGQVLFTGKPLHIAAETLPPSNGFALGLGFHKEYNTAIWRFSVDSVADASFNASWKAGIYGTAILTGRRKIVVSTDTDNTAAPPPPPLESRRPTFNMQLETITLNQLTFYGLGNFTAENDRTFFGMDHRFVGGDAEIPLPAGFALLGEVGGRWYSVRGRNGQNSPSIEQAFTPITAPALLEGQTYLQTGEGISFTHPVGRLLRLNYQAKLQQFHSLDSDQFSFRRFTVRADNRFAWLRTRTAANGNKTTDEVGSVSLGGKLVESIADTGSAVPFYLLPTLGGSDLNKERVLSSYPDYRFRAPHLWLARATVEHIIKGPVGAIAWAETGKVALNRNELDFNHLRHTFAVGATIKAGNFPYLSLVFAWGGHESTHTVIDIRGLGPAKGPLLY